jgi:hypothetical protein
MQSFSVGLVAAILSACGGSPDTASVASLPDLSPDSVRAIARDAYIYGYPIVENYRIIYQSAQDTGFSKYAPFNTFYHEPDVAGPKDTLFVAPNGDTPYSYAVFDLRQGPVVIRIPAADHGRYFVFPLYDMFTHIIYSLSPRTVRPEGGRFLLASVDWKGKLPQGIDTVLRSETDFVYTIVRTQLFSRDDLTMVHKFQSQYRIESLAAFNGQAAPAVGKGFTHLPLEPENPSTPAQLAFFDLLNSCLAFCHPHASETDLLKRFAQIGVIAGKPFVGGDSSFNASVLAGIADAKKAFTEKVPTVKYAAELFGTREQLKNDYLARGVGAWVGIYANQLEEFMGLQGYERQADGKPYDGHNQYTVTFKKDEFPPVGAFWSVTVYALPSRFMYANEINRNLISSSMLKELHWNADSSLTIYLQHTMPQGVHARNWLPVPLGPFTMAFRTYLPGEAIRSGKYRVPVPVMNGPAEKP